MRTTIPLKSPVSLEFLSARVLVPLAVLAAVLSGVQMLAAQTPSTPAPSATAHRPAHPHKRPSAAQAEPAAAQPAPTPVTPPAPEVPAWPANEKPAQASITWDSQGLRIDAANSSLQQILKDVSTATGAKVEGLSADERVFGAYGPGQARDVLSQLLQGSGYNVIMIGDQGQGAPRQIVLSSRHIGDTPAAANGNQANDEDADTEEPPPPPAIRPGFGPGGPPRSPQQIMQEMQQRQQQMQQRAPTQPQ